MINNNGLFKNRTNEGEGEERRRHFALIVCSALILRCLGEGLYPGWDAHNMGSVHLAEKFGYEFDHEYTAYEVASDERTH